jgi:hypothetical protein
MKARTINLRHRPSRWGGYCMCEVRSATHWVEVYRRRPPRHMALCVKLCANVYNSADIVNLTAEL